jgi:hypothetical protein
MFVFSPLGRAWTKGFAAVSTFPMIFTCRNAHKTFWFCWHFQADALFFGVLHKLFTKLTEFHMGMVETEGKETSMRDSSRDLLDEDNSKRNVFHPSCYLWFRSCGSCVEGFGYSPSTENELPPPALAGYAMTLPSMGLTCGFCDYFC